MAFFVLVSAPPFRFLLRSVVSDLGLDRQLLQDRTFVGRHQSWVSSEWPRLVIIIIGHLFFTLSRYSESMAVFRRLDSSGSSWSNPFHSSIASYSSGEVLEELKDQAEGVEHRWLKLAGSNSLAQTCWLKLHPLTLRMNFFAHAWRMRLTKVPAVTEAGRWRLASTV